MTKRKPKPIGVLINTALIKLEDLLDDAEGANQIKDCVTAILAIDKNNRDLQIAIKETIVPNMTDDEIKNEIERSKADQ